MGVGTRLLMRLVAGLAALALLAGVFAQSAIAVRVVPLYLGALCTLAEARVESSSGSEAPDTGAVHHGHCVACASSFAQAVLPSASRPASPAARNAIPARIAAVGIPPPEPTWPGGLSRAPPARS